MQIPVNKKFDLRTLAAEISTALGFHVALVGRLPGEVDNHGNPLPAVVELVNNETGARLTEFDLNKVNAAITAHVPPPDPVNPGVPLAVALKSATTLPQVRAALIAFADRLSQGGLS